MHLLPKANPLKEHLPASKAVVSNVLQKLAAEDFTGYMNHTSPGYNSFCIFALGNMVSVVSIAHGTQTTGFDAFEQMLESIFSFGGELNIYRMTPDLVMCAHALLMGSKLFSDEVIRQIDMKEIFADLKNRGLNGVVRFSTIERQALLFFKNGTPIGFYTNGEQSIEASPEESRKVAAMPGAKLDVFSINPQKDIIPYDLLHMFDTENIWNSISARHAAPLENIAQTEQPVPVNTDSPDKLTALIEDLRDVAIAYLSKSGGVIIEKQLQEAGGSSILYDRDKTDQFLYMVQQEAMETDDQARIDEMIELMRSEIASRVQNS